MNRTTLKFLRVVIPGFILLFEFIPLLHFLDVPFKIGSGLLSYSFAIAVSLVIGAVYHMFEVRYTVTNISHRKIDLNIVTSIIKLFGEDITQEQHNYLKKGKIKHIFYHFIDKDESLSAKSQLVYFNGLLWTSTADMFILSVFSSIVYLLVGYFLLSNTEVIVTGVVYGGLALLSLCLHALTVIKHYKLSNDQIEYMETHYLLEIREKISNALGQMVDNGPH